MRKVLTFAGLGVLILLLIPLLVFGAVQTGPGKRWVASLASRALSSPGHPVTLAGLSGTVPFNMKLREFVEADRAGAWLKVEDAAVQIAARDLLAGRLTFRRVAAREVQYFRQGESDAAESSSATPSFHLPIAIAVDDFTIGALVLEPPLAAAPLRFGVSGKGALEDGNAKADLAIECLDGEAGSAALHLDFGGSPAHLHLAANAAEPSGRVLSLLLGRSDALPVTLTLTGDGPLTNWQGRLTAAEGTAARIDAVFTILGGDGYHLRATGGAAIASLLPPDFRGIAGADDTIDLRLGLGPDQSVTLEALRLATPAAVVTATGTYRPDGAIAGKASITASDLAVFGPTVGTGLSGRGAIDAEVSGSIADPAAKLTLSLENAGAFDAQAARLSAALDLHAASATPEAPLVLSASGAIEGIALPSGPPAGGLGSRVDWRVAASFDRRTERVKVSDLALQAADISLTAQAAGDRRSGGAGEARLRVPDLSRLGIANLTGGLDIAADFHGSADGAAVIVLSGATSGLGLGEPRLAAALGGKLMLAGTLRRAADGGVAVDDLTVDGKDLQFSAQGRRTADDQIAASLRLLVPQLGAFEPAASGRIALDGTASGTLQAPKIAASLDADKLVLDRYRLDRLKARLSIGNLTDRAGRLDAEFHGEGLDGTLTAQGALGDDGAFALSRLHLVAGGSTIDGTLRASADHRFSGKLTAAVPDLRPWSSLAGATLAGNLRATATFADARGQSLDLDAAAAALSYGAGPPTTLRGLRLEARLTNLFGQPSGRITADLSDGVAGVATLDHLHLVSTSVAPGRFTVTAQVQGKIEQKLDLATQATVALRPAAGELRVTRLSGSLGAVPVTLHRALTVQWKGPNLSVADLTLGLGSGSITGSGAVQGERLSLRLRGDKLALHQLAALAGREDVSGALGFDLALSGSPVRPQGRITLDGERLRIAGKNSDLPPLGVTVSAELSGDQLRFRGRVAGPKSDALGFQGSAPLVLRIEPFTAEMPKTGAVSLHLEGNGQAADFAEFLPSEDRIAGLVHVDVTVVGTIADPMASGSVSLRDGRYDNLLAGASLTGVHFTLVGNRDRLVLQDFGAGDGANGKVTGGGGLALVDGSGASTDLSLTLTQFRALGRDDATASVSGKIALTGALTDLHIVGRLTIDRADLMIPKSVPTSLRPIPVVVIDSATGQVLSQPALPKSGGIGPAIALDIVVDMPGRVFIRGDGLESEWRGRITLGGDSAAPQIGGQLDVVHGAYQLLGQTFQLTRGTVSFLGGNAVDPALSIEAQAQTSNILAIVRISGTATAPKISMSSQPQLPQAEILSRVLFGSSVSQISAAQGLQIAQAAASLAGSGGPDVLTRLRQGLGLDRLTFGSNSYSLLPGFGGPTVGPGNPNLQAGTPAAAGVAGSTVSAGKYVADGVYVGVSQGLTPGSSTVNAQIDLTKHIGISSEAGQTSGTGIGINWKLDY